MRTIKITVGDQERSIKEFTLETLENLEEAVMGPIDLVKEPNAAGKRNLRILSAALMQDHPSLTVEQLRSQRLGDGTIQAVAAAVKAVLEFAGYLVAGEAEDKKSEASPRGEETARAA